MEGDALLLDNEFIQKMIENTTIPDIPDLLYTNYNNVNNSDINNNNVNNNNFINNNNNYNNNNFMYESTPSPYSDTSSSFSPPASPLSPSSESLFQQLKNGKLTTIRDVDSAFLKEMLNLLYCLSTTQNIESVKIQKHHPTVRQEGQIYLGQGFEKRGITKAKNSTNSVKFGGKHKQFCAPDYPFCLEYNFDSPPECYKHIIVHQFFLNKPEEKTGEKPTKKSKSEEKKELPGLVNQELRVFVVLPTKNELKRKHPDESKTAGWEANGDVLSTSNEVRVNNTIYADKVITPHNASLSDETTKENISSVDPIESLHSLLGLTISKFNYKGEFADPSVQNIGVMAQQVAKVLPGSAIKIEGSGKFDGKLAVNHNNVMYNTVSALQGLTLIVQCLVKALETHQIDASKNIYKTLSTLGHSLPPLPNNISPLEVLQKHNLLNPKKGDSVPIMNLDTSSKMVREFMTKTKHLYNCYEQDTREVNANDDERERDTENKKKPLERWKIIEERLQELVRQKHLLNAKWEVRCNGGCDTALCTLSDLHFFFVPEDQMHYLVSDDEKKWIENPTEEPKIDSFTVAHLKCPGCGQKLGRRVKNRGKGSPKRELLLDSVVFVNSKIEYSKSFDSAADALNFFSERLCLETRFTTREDELAEALEADRLKRESFPESTRIYARPLSRVGAGTSASGSGRAIMCKRDDTIADLLEKIKQEFPNDKAEALYHNEDQVDVIDLKKYVNEILRHDDKVYFGLLPQNEVLISLRMYQKELIEQAVKANRVVVCPTGSGKTAVALEVDRVLRSKIPNFKSVMVVRDLPLSVQQYTYFRKNTKLRVNLVNSERPLTHDWSEMLELENVVVLTAQVLLNKLADNSAQLSQISLLILDEAHNTAKNHPFNCIMRDFYHKLPEDQRPHILALTASPPAHTNLEMTKALIKNFEKSTDSKILLVDEYKVELRKDISIPRTVVHPINPSAYEKSFINLVNGAMNELESKVKFKVTGEEVELQRELTRGSLEYEATCGNEELKFYNRVLLSFNDSVELAIEELKSKLDVYPSVKKILDGLQVMGNAEKTKLELFLKTLDSFKNVENFRGIVFVGTKLGGEMMKQAIINNKMDFLRPNVFFGHGGKSGLGMSSNEQTRVISQFNSGEINLLIATSVAEEGLDLKACNVVFRYDSVYSHRSLIQTRGRARQKDSQFIIFYHTDSPAEKAWYGSMRKLKNMLKAVGEQLATSPFMSEPIYIDMSGQVTIPKRIFSDDDEDGMPAQELKEDKADSTEGNGDKDEEENNEDSEQEESDEEDEEEESDDDDSDADSKEDSDEEQLIKKTSKISLSPNAPRSESTHSNGNTPISTSSLLPISSTNSTPPATLNLSIPPTPTFISHVPKPSIPSTPPSIPSSSPLPPSTTPSTPPHSTPPPSNPPPSTLPPSTPPPSTPPPSTPPPSTPTPSILSTPTTPISLSNPSTPSSPSTSSTPTSPSVTDPMMLLNQKCQALKCKNPLMQKENVAGPKESPIWKVTVTIYNKSDNSPVSFSAQATGIKAAEKLVAAQILAHNQDWTSGIPL